MNVEELKTLVLVHTPAPQQEAIKNKLDQMTPEQLVQLTNRIQQGVQQRVDWKPEEAEQRAAQSLVELTLVKAGLKNEPANLAVLKRKLGQFFTVEQVREAIKDENFRNKLVWDSSEPFAELLQQEKQVAQDDQQRRREFTAVVTALTSLGIANVADNDANFNLCEHQLTDVLVSGSAANLREAISRGLIHGLAQNGEAQTAELDKDSRDQLLQSVEPRLDQFDQNSFRVRRRILDEGTYAENRERVQLVGEIADNHSPLASENNKQFRVLFLSVKTNQEYRQQVEQQRERRRLARMSPSELRAYNEHQRAATPQPEPEFTPDGQYRILKPDSKFMGQLINKPLLWKLSSEDLKRLTAIYGRQQIEDRVRNGIPVAA